MSPWPDMTLEEMFAWWRAYAQRHELTRFRFKAGHTMGFHMLEIEARREYPEDAK